MSEGKRLELAHRAPIYAWLARPLIGEVDAELWRELQREPFRTLLLRLEPSLEEGFGHALSEASRNAHAEEFARLFLLPNGVSPFASSWLDGSGLPERGRDELTALVESGYAGFGRSPDDAGAWGRVPRDHVAMILDLVALAEFSSDRDDAEIAAHLDNQLVGDWIDRFARALAENARLPLYRALGRLLAELHAPL